LFVCFDKFLKQPESPKVSLLNLKTTPQIQSKQNNLCD
jgi:hypothetical protein